MEAKANLIHAAKDEAVEEVIMLRLSERGGSMIGKDEPEKEEHEAVDILIDKEVLDFMIKDEVFEELNMVKLIRAAKDEAAEEVRKLRLSDESEKEEHEAVDIMIDKEDGSGDADATGQDAD